MTNLSAVLLAALAMAQASDRQPIIVDGVPTIRIALAGFDLSRDEDREHVSDRIRWAARHVCSNTRQPDQSWYERVACTKHAISDAQEQLAAHVERNRNAAALSDLSVDVSASLNPARP